MAAHSRKGEAVTLVNKLRESLGANSDGQGKRLPANNSNQVPNYGNRSVHLRQGRFRNGADDPFGSSRGSKKSEQDVSSADSQRSRRGQDDDQYTTTQVLDVDTLPTGQRSIIQDSMNSKWRPNVGLGLGKALTLREMNAMDDKLEDLDSLKNSGNNGIGNTTNRTNNQSMYQTLMSFSTDGTKGFDNEMVARFAPPPSSAPGLDRGDWRPSTQQSLQQGNISALSTASLDSKLTIDDDTHALCGDPSLRTVPPQRTNSHTVKVGILSFLLGLVIGLILMYIITVSTWKERKCDGGNLTDSTNNTTGQTGEKSGSRGTTELEIIVASCTSQLAVCLSQVKGSTTLATTLNSDKKIDSSEQYDDIDDKFLRNGTDYDSSDRQNDLGNSLPSNTNVPKITSKTEPSSVDTTTKFYSAGEYTTTTQMSAKTSDSENESGANLKTTTSFFPDSAEKSTQFTEGSSPTPYEHRDFEVTSANSVFTTTPKAPFDADRENIETSPVDDQLTTTPIYDKNSYGTQRSNSDDMTEVTTTEPSHTFSESATVTSTLEVPQNEGTESVGLTSAQTSAVTPIVTEETNDDAAQESYSSERFDSTVAVTPAHTTKASRHTYTTATGDNEDSEGVLDSSTEDSTSSGNSDTPKNRSSRQGKANGMEDESTMWTLSVTTMKTTTTIDAYTFSSNETLTKLPNTSPKPSTTWKYGSTRTPEPNMDTTNFGLDSTTTSQTPWYENEEDFFPTRRTPGKIPVEDLKKAGKDKNADIQSSNSPNLRQTSTPTVTTVGRRTSTAKNQPEPANSGGADSRVAIKGPRGRKKGWFQRFIEVVKEVINSVTNGNLDIK